MRKHSIPNFIQKAWKMMQEEANWPIVSWDREGTSFQVHDQSLFSSNLLPIYFKHSNFASFIRQLNMYNFHKKKTADGNTQFFHKLFRKNHPELLVGIRRKPSEAEINEEDQLIRQLAPECLEGRIESYPENSTDFLKSPTLMEETQPSYFVPDLSISIFPDLMHMWMLTPVMMNPYADSNGCPQKKIRTNIIIQGVSPGPQFTYQF